MKEPAGEDLASDDDLGEENMTRIRKNILLAALVAFLPLACAAPAVSTPGTKHIMSEGLAQMGPYSHVVTAGDLVFVSGMIAHDKDTGFAPAEIDAQTRQVFKNLSSALEAAGLKLSDVVKVNVFLKSPGDMPRMNEIYTEFFPINPPARTTVPGVDWGRDDILIEIDVIAARR